MMQYYSYNARYGQAQKVVNMAFKYLYCCDGAEVYKSKFEASISFRQSGN